MNYRFRHTPEPAVWPEEACPAWAHPTSREYLKSRSISKEEAYRYKLAFVDSGVWKHRLLIPQYDRQGNLQFFQGRSLNGDEPRYRTAGPRGIYYSSDSITLDSLGSRYLLVTEGPFDLWAVARLVPTTIATLGTMVSEKQLKEILSLGAKSIAILFDQDAQAAAYGLQLRLNPFVPTEVLFCPAKDPAESSQEELRKLLS